MVGNVMAYGGREWPSRYEDAGALAARRWARRPSELDADKPSVSRVYDWYRGGAANFATDRAFGRRVQSILPELRDLALCHCRFLARAVWFCASLGIPQFLDIGSGIPDAWGIHRAAHAVSPECRVVYVDNEAVAVEATRRMVADDDRLGVARADLRDPDAVLDNPVTARLIELAEPVGLVMGLVVHFVPDSDDPASLLNRYRDAVAPGSHLVLSHDTADGHEEDMAHIAGLYEETDRPLIPRDRAALTALLGGFQLLDPGIVHMPLCRPDRDDPTFDRPERTCVYAAVART
ncbi:MAG: SAM-dependent methyltransferase [Kutzneria sp.]|nr:SAM-dependent methyltransferase [Kutzneria sp.]